VIRPEPRLLVKDLFATIEMLDRFRGQEIKSAIVLSMPMVAGNSKIGVLEEGGI
jgi:hypothetical protein